MYWRRILVGAMSITLGLMLCVEAYDAVAEIAKAEPEPPPSPPSIIAIRELAELTVLEVQVTDVATASINGHAGGTDATVLVRGTVTLAVDLEQAEFVEVDHQRRHVVLALPPPEVRRVAIDPSTTRVISCERTGLWQLAVGEAREGEAISQALVVGQQRLYDAAGQDDLDHRARRHTVAVLGRFLGEMGWTIEVRWTD